ncbi:MAG TPA: shikimate kinase [Myxococcota bacterium]|nr:shikimate kinase [Myxococcota bacterium]
MVELISYPALSKNLVLIGGRGSGKSSLAKRLARENRNFILFSLDALIRYEAEGAPIPEIVAREGWAGFRARELAVVEKVAAIAGGALVDTGGGVVVELDRDGRERYSARKVDALRRHGRIVYLHRTIDYLLQRIERDDSRPPLSDGVTFRQIMKRRDPWYRRAADHVIECGTRSKTELTREVLSWFYRDQKIAS